MRSECTFANTLRVLELSLLYYFIYIPESLNHTHSDDNFALSDNKDGLCDIYPVIPGKC